MEFQRAGLLELPEVLALMREFYPLERLTLDEALAKKALLWVLENPERGAIFLLRAESETAGYIALTAGVSLEFGGPFLLLDELYLRPPYRGRGLGIRMLDFVEAYARQTDRHALRLEVHDDNTRAKDLYLKHGFIDDHRWIYTKLL